MISALFILGGYLAGTIPSGVLLGRLAGGDPRSAGSGNIGATNVTRTLGKKWGALTLLGDAAKGALPTGLVLAYGVPDVDVPWPAAATAFAAVMGHCYPIWLKFRGGKGVATAFGAMLVLSPVTCAVAALTWIVVAVFSRVPAFGSLAGAAMFPVITRVEGQPFSIHVFAVAAALLMLWRHRTNLRAYAKARRARNASRDRLYKSKSKHQ